MDNKIWIVRYNDQIWSVFEDEKSAKEDAKKTNKMLQEGVVTVDGFEIEKGITQQKQKKVILFGNKNSYSTMK